ncbi:MAG TPA: hypothetical protein VD767_04345, partial [Thermomicrobiales bacterium]|nr:hypothetical protein [Thermomicrobiales bacterium]
EMAPLDTPITTADSDLRTPGGDYFGSTGTLMGFGADETYTLEDMLYGMLLPSGNDAANAIARTLGAQPGDSDEEAVQRFLDLLNQRVVDMGLENTHFMNPHGWGEDGHYSAAADVAAFSRLVVNYPTLMEIMGTQSYTTSNGALTVTNTNRSLTLYPSVVAGKTGYDWDAGYCLLNIAERDDATIIAVTLDGLAPNDWYDDNATLLEYGFERQAAVTADGGAFDGDVVGFTDPSAAEIARSAQPAGEFRPNDSTPAAVELSPTTPAGPNATEESTEEAPQPVPRPETGDGSGISGSGPWVMATLAILVLAGAGVQAWRAVHRPRFAEHPDVPAAERGSDGAAPVDIKAPGS